MMEWIKDEWAGPLLLLLLLFFFVLERGFLASNLHYILCFCQSDLLLLYPCWDGIAISCGLDARLWD